MRLRHILVFGLSIVATGGLVRAQVPDPTLPHADYSNPALWLCRPDLKDNKCKVDLTTTVIPANGETSIEKFSPAIDPKIDCFFVYPTVSFDPGWLSSFVPDHTEFDDIKQQFARFGSVCRQFAPVYRQFTLTALRAPSGGPQPVGDRPAPGFGGYTDVLDAWNYYMSHENMHRGVVLIGHSQGAALIARLIANEIDGKPAHKQFVSAIILGAPVMVPEGKDVGGTYQRISLCRHEDQLGCVISYMTFRDTNPPPETSRFGKSRDGLVAACANPANLATGSGEPVSYFLTKGFLNNAGGNSQPDWLTPHKDITTSFVRTPGLVTTTCVHQGEFTYLALHVNALGGPRTHELAGEVVRASGPDLSWGLHILDMDHSMGDLLRIVKKQGAAYAASAGKLE